ncbi:MAG: YaiI/YqxD family protein [Geminicoccaceae bacterium]
MLDLYVDADACPVKDEIYRVAERYGLKVFVVANMWMRVPDHPMIELVTVADGLDVADDWIAERAGEGDIAITADIPLAARCVKNGSRAIGPSGRPFTEDSIGDVLATRNLMTELRETGEIRGTGHPFTKQDRSRFLQTLDTTIQAIKRTRRPAGPVP